MLYLIIIKNRTQCKKVMQTLLRGNIHVEGNFISITTTRYKVRIIEDNHVLIPRQNEPYSSIINRWKNQQDRIISDKV